MTMFRGFKPTLSREEFDLDTLVSHCIGALDTPPCSDEDLISLADDEVRYREALVKRLVYVPVFEDNPVSFYPAEYPFAVVADRERLKDLLEGILEDLAGLSGHNITVSDSKENNRGFRPSVQNSLGRTLIFRGISLVLW